MNLNKRIALLLAAVMLLTVPFAAVAEEMDTELEGYITELVEGGFLMEDKELGEIMLNVDEQTVLDGLLLEEELAVGQYVLVWYDGRTTRSLPPQAHADKVGSYELNGIVTEVMEDGSFLMHDDTIGNVLVHVDGTMEPIYPDMEVTVFYDGVMALSEPGRVAAREIIVPTLVGMVSDLSGHGFTLTDEEGNSHQIVADEYTVVGRLLPVEEEADMLDGDDGDIGEAEEAAADEAAADETADNEAADAEDEAVADATADNATADATADKAAADGDEEQLPLIDLTAVLAEGDMVVVYYTGRAIGDEPMPVEADEEDELADGQPADLTEPLEEGEADEGDDIDEDADITEDADATDDGEQIDAEADDIDAANGDADAADEAADEAADAQYLALELIVLTPPEAE